MTSALEPAASVSDRSRGGLLRQLALWAVIAPFASLAVLIGAALGLHGYYVALLGLAVAASVFAAVHHAEVIAQRVGEPFGTLVLAMSVTLIEVALIVSLMIAGGAQAEALARDTVFAAVMIILTGIVGLSLTIGGLKHREQLFRLDGVSASLVALATISVMTFVFPNYTLTTPGPLYSPGQLALVAVVSLVVYGAFIFTQTLGHRDYFLHEESEDEALAHGAKPSSALVSASAVLLLLSLLCVVLLAKALAPSLELAVERVGAPYALVGVIIAAIILLPEGLAAVRAALQNRVQTSLNLALGSALASIGLTIPAVSFLSLYMNTKLILGIDAKSTVLLLLSLFLAALALRTGRTIVLHGIALLVVFAIYLFTTVVP
jgi:Ca2+:H+ antiporter